MNDERRVFKVALPSNEVEAFLDECRASQWYAVDTGERIMTDEGPDAEAVVLVEPAARTRARTASPIMH
ncbi:MAG TPA: hypothetical protein VM582_00530 [Candidatus Thermoplasmatota archaeon]|nr:hypothetical protein [Candidatus Thermoplasmatota archaeon]